MCVDIARLGDPKPMLDHVDLLMAHIRTARPLVYMGKGSVGVNRRAFPLHIFQSFLDAHPAEYPRDTKRLDGTDHPAGQRNTFYKPFRDEWLPLALQRIRAEGEGVRLDSIPETEYDIKVVKRLGVVVDVQTRSIKGWEVLTEKNAASAYAGMGAALPVLSDYYAAEVMAAALDTECGDCPPLAVTDAELWDPCMLARLVWEDAPRVSRGRMPKGRGKKHPIESDARVPGQKRPRKSAKSGSGPSGREEDEAAAGLTKEKMRQALERKETVARAAEATAAAFARCEVACACGITPCPTAKWKRCPTCGPKNGLCKIRACVTARKGAQEGG